ncbi:protein kinase [Kocuria sp. CPCC 205300]|uniref:protein kinase domain-containing protein n=1 Tax=Kocuria sabuli TaxID=3071448 RepID=UPI0036D7B466
MQHALPDHLTGPLLEGRYELGPRIARGGTATVYRAVDTRLERTVAVKLMHPHLAEDPAAAERFVREARAAARLSHPHVVSVLDQGHAPDGVPYLVMEHVEGSTLRDLLRRRGALTPREALEVMEAAVDGLAAAHRAGLVHRDVKPENVLIAAGGRVTVADFGLTRAVDQHTASGSVLGTVGYASPELVTGRRVDTRADVYSAGIVLFELLCGRRPFEGTPLAVARAHAEGGIPDLRSLEPGVPAALARLVARATARDPEHRPADAGDLLGRLRAVRAQLRPEELDRAPVHRPPRGGAPVQAQVPAGTRSETSGTGAGGQGSRTETLGPPTAPTEAIGRTGAATEVLRPSAAATEALHRSDPAARPGGVHPGGSSDPWRPEVELRPARPLRTAAHLALAALAVAAAAFLGWLIGSGPGGTASVPEVRGTGPELARQYLAGAGLENVAVHETPDPLAPAGTVIGTDPGAAATVRPAEQVVLFVSTGP